MRRQYSLLYASIASLFFLSSAVQAQSFAPIRLSAGGPQYVDLQGQVWMPDYGFSPGTSTFSTTASISGTLAPEIYQHERYATSFSYTFSVPNGIYIVDLRFAEIFFTSPGQRVFNVSINGQQVLSNFDIFAQAGCANCALDKAFTVQVVNNTITIALSATVNNAKIDGIEITQESAASQPVSTTQGTSTTGSGTTSTGSTSNSGTTVNNQSSGSNSPTSVLVNCGGGKYTDPQGNVWAADYGYNGTTATYSTTAAISNTTAPALYQKERYGVNFIYELPIANGNYTVTLKFAELYWTKAGQRVFSVAINNQWVLPNFDIIAQAGAPDRAIDKTFNVTVTNNTIVIQFLASVDNGKIDAIEVVPQTSTTVTQPVNTPATLSLSPTFASLPGGGQTQFSVTMNGITNPPVIWTVSPALGSISTTGLFTAPSGVWTTETVTVMATSIAVPSLTSSAAVTIVPTSSLTPVAPPVTSITPSQAQLTTSQTQQFTITGLSSTQGTGGTQVTVNWSTNPSVGTINSNGLYTAPSSITTQQTITVTATNAASSAVVGTASITLIPPPPPPAAPTGVTATAGNAQVTLSWTASSGATSYNVLRSTTNGGTYTPVASGVTATTYVDTSVTNGTTYYYVIDAVSANGTSPNSTQVSAQPIAPVPAAPTGVTATAGNAQVTLSWTASSGATSYSVLRSTTNGGTYTPVASGVTATTYVDTSVTNGTTYYYVIDAVSANGTSPNSTQVSAQPSAPATPQVTTIQLPVEVIGPNGYTVNVPFSIPTGTNLNGQLQLWMQIHGLRTETQASVQVNTSGWTAINSSNVTLLGLAGAYGGIGGGFHTLSMTVNLPAGAIVIGANTVSFRFNETDGNVSGFRVLAFNVQNSSGGSLIPSSTFVNDDPNTWQPPSTNASDLAAGQSLYQTAALTIPTSSGSQPIQAHCMDCHTQDGRDLKYFNYSNNSIEARAQFHGLTAQQGAQIASYIRSLNVPNPGRPWNPPYQPGPGLDSQPVSSWAAGAGIGAVLDSDAAMQPYLMPGGSTAGWAANQYLNPRELPIAIQLADWNSWLPQVHPMDAFGTSFTSSSLNSYYGTIRSQLSSNVPYPQVLPVFDSWTTAQQNLLGPIETAATSSGWTPTLRTQVYSAALWQLVKLWEINQQFGLEGMSQAVFGATANVRGWYGRQPFMTSPNMLHIAAGTGLGNGSPMAGTYLAYIWYHLQLILNDGQGKEINGGPIDYGYMYYAVKGLNWNYNDSNAPTSLPEAMLQMMWYIKSLQEFTLTGVGPQAGLNGWTPIVTTPYDLIDSAWSGIWSATSASTEASVLQAYLQNWFAQASQYTPQQYYQGGWATATDNPATLNPFTSWGGQIWNLLPWFRSAGVDATLTYQIANWAATIWPNGNWAMNNSTICTSGGGCTSN